MAKIPFDIKYRPQIESGEYKVETRDGKKVRVLCHDVNSNMPVIALVTFNNGSEAPICYYSNGTMISNRESPLDLFIVTTEPELTEFEKVVRDRLWRTLEYSDTFRKDENKWAKELAAELLSIAKQQLLQSGELLTQEHHKELMETQYNETLEGVKKNWRDYFTPQAVTDIYNAGRNDVLKDLSRWGVKLEDMEYVSLGINLEKEIELEWKKCNPTDDGMGSEYAYISIEQFYSILHRFYNMGLKIISEI